MCTASLLALFIAPTLCAVPWPRVLLTEAAATRGAVALDGTPAALYLRRGQGADEGKYVLFFEGGGWCESPEDCVSRSNTSLGSSRYSTSGYAARDLLQPDCTLNPRFCNHSMVYAQYLDGTSRSSDVEAPVVVGGSTIYHRGHRILGATLEALLSPSGPGEGLPSLARASELIITGSSAGGLTTYLHSDEISGAVLALNPACAIRAIPEVGFFIDGVSIWGARIMTSVFARVAEFGNVTGGSPTQVNAACVAATPPPLRHHCFMAQFTLPFTTTPTFVVNSMVDEWQAENILAPNTNTLPAVSTYPPFKPCIAHPSPAACNATQWGQWRGLGTQFLEALQGARNATPPALAAHHGGVISSCPIHTTLIGGLSRRIVVGGKSLYTHIVEWLDGGAGDTLTIDQPYPSNPTCPQPGELPLEWRGY